MPARTKSGVTALLAKLPPERRREMARVRALIRKRLPRGYEEVVVKGMLVYQVPLAVYPDTYNKQPLWYVALASEKSYLSLHLMAAYGDTGTLTDLQAAFRAAGKKLDMGKSCIRFQRADDLPLEAIGQLISRWPLEQYIEAYEAVRAPAAKGKGGKGAKSARAVRNARKVARKPKAAQGKRR